MAKIVDNYTLTTYLGKGEYGKVYKATNIDTKIDVAIKMIPLDKFSEIGKLTELTKNQIETIKLLQENINIIKFVEMIKTNHFIYLVYEYCEGGTLEDFIKSKERISERQAIKIFRQLISAFKSLNEYHILHRDVKSNNIFFKSGHLKLADFGFCKRLRGSDDLTQTSLGSPLYMAPQVLNGDVYGSKADIWSCGVVLYEMLFGYCPFGSCNMKELINIYNSDKMDINMPTDKIPITPSTQIMLRRMLQRDQFRRISWDDFFYEYELTSQGVVNRKEKDFQYDLMKLMKKNTDYSKKRKEQQNFKFDWTKITEKNSSIHSQELNGAQHHSQTEVCLDELVLLKKKVKQFENQHSKMLELSLIIESMLNAAKDFQYSTPILYFLVYNLDNLLVNAIPQITKYVEEKKNLLESNPNQKNSLNKLFVVFSNEQKSISSKVNSIKVTLLNHEGLDKSVFQYPKRNITKRFLKQFCDTYNEHSPNSSALNLEGDRNDAIYLLRVIWGVGLYQSSDEEELLDQKQKIKAKKLREMLSIKEETTKFEVSAELYKLFVSMGI